jgi:hypothetical protein
MGQGKERDVEVVASIGIEGLEEPVPSTQVRVDTRQRSTGAAVRGQQVDTELRMVVEKSDEFAAPVPGSAEHGGL